MSPVNPVMSIPSSASVVSTGSFSEPGDLDIVCGRGKGSYNRPGNKRLRSVVQRFLPAYKAAPTRSGKSLVLYQVLTAVEDGGRVRFVKFNPREGWYNEISESEARDKVAHAMREATAAARKNGKTQRLIKLVKPVVPTPPSASSPSNLCPSMSTKYTSLAAEQLLLARLLEIAAFRNGHV